MPIETASGVANRPGPDTMEIRPIPYAICVFQESRLSRGAPECLGKGESPRGDGLSGGTHPLHSRPIHRHRGRSESPSASGQTSTDGPGTPGAAIDRRQAIEKLKGRDQEVRAHEQAHKSVAGPYALGGPSLHYARGPDGRLYAVGGEVKLDTSEVPNNPKATIRKAQTIQRAALAPAEPSAQDRQVAARAKTMELRARQELMRMQKDDTQEPGEPDGPDRAVANRPSGFHPSLQRTFQGINQRVLTQITHLIDTFG